jgi:hypothetical protein
MRRGLALAVAAVAGLLAACGGGGGTDTTVSAAEFRRQADAICAKYQNQLNALGTPSSLADLKDYVNKAVPIIEKGNAELQALEPPEELAATWNRALELNRQQLDIVRDLQDAVEAEDEAKMQDLLEQAQAANEESDKLARQLGLRECGEES